jgi:hypothetical protein
LVDQTDSNYSKIRLLYESSKLDRPVENITLHTITQREFPNLWAFVESKMRRTRYSPIPSEIYQIQICRSTKEESFMTRLFDDARTEVDLAPFLKFQKPSPPQVDPGNPPNEEFESGMKTFEEFESGLKAYQRFCEPIASRHLKMTKVDENHPVDPSYNDPPRPGVNLTFAWHAGASGVVESLCKNGVKEVSLSTDAGYFGKGCYFTPEFDYSERYARWKDPIYIGDDGSIWTIERDKKEKRTKQAIVGYKCEKTGSMLTTMRPDFKSCYAVILWACAVPLTPYVVTSRDYPCALPPFRDANVPYGMCKFYGRHMQRACSAHFISTKQYQGDENPLHSLFPRKNDILPLFSNLEQRTKYIKTRLPTKKDQGILQHVCVASPELPFGWIEQKNDRNEIVYFDPDGNRRPDLPLMSAPSTKCNPDESGIPETYPHTLITNVDYQYTPESVDGGQSHVEGHELVLRDSSMAVPIAVVYVIGPPPLPFLEDDVDEDAAVQPGVGLRLRQPRYPPSLQRTSVSQSPLAIHSPSFSAPHHSGLVSWTQEPPPPPYSLLPGALGAAPASPFLTRPLDFPV